MAKKKDANEEQVKKLRMLIDKFLMQIAEIMPLLRRLDNRIHKLKSERDPLECIVEKQDKSWRKTLECFNEQEKPESEELKRLRKVYAKLHKCWRQRSELITPSHDSYWEIKKFPLQPKDLLPPKVSDDYCDELLDWWLASKKNLHSELPDNKKIALAHSLRRAYIMRIYG